MVTSVVAHLDNYKEIGVDRENNRIVTDILIFRKGLWVQVDVVFCLMMEW